MAGRKIDDHSFWAGRRSNHSIFPDGVKSKSYADVMGAGHVGTKYPDTTEAIHRDQESGVRKVHSHSSPEDKRT